MAAPRKYHGLLAYLAALPTEQRTVTLSFTELEAILGWALSFTVRSDGAYWTRGPTARANWLAAGWTARLDRLNRTVTFTRR